MSHIPNAAVVLIMAVILLPTIDALRPNKLQPESPARTGRNLLLQGRSSEEGPNSDRRETARENPVTNKSIWYDNWTNFTFYHPTGTVSNVYNDRVVWANVGFMNLGHLFKLSLLAYPGALLPLALIFAIVVGMSLTLKPACTSPALGFDVPGPPAAEPSELEEGSQQLYEYWMTFCCMLPSLLVFGVPIALCFISAHYPQETFTITAILSSAFIFTNGLYMVFFVPFVLAEMKCNMQKSAREILTNTTADEQMSVSHWIIFANYKEDLDILTAALASVARSSLAKTQIGVILAMEEREGEQGQNKAQQLRQNFAGQFREIVTTSHPMNLPNDPPGKASNVAHAFKWLAQHINQAGHDPSKVLLTVADADTEFHAVYFELLTQKYLENAPDKRNDFIWQSPVLHLKNYHRQPGPVLVGTMFTSMAEMAGLADPNAIRFPYSTYTLTVALANEVGGWDAEWIAEDWHMGIKCFLLTLGRTTVQPVLLPIVNYTPEDEGWVKTCVARFAQAKRHALGFSDLAYFFMMIPLIFVRVSSMRRKGAGLADFWNLLLKGIPYLVKFVNVHVIIGILALYAVLDGLLKNVMVAWLDHSISGIFDRTFFSTAMFAAASAVLTVIVTFAFQLLYRLMRGHVETPGSQCWTWIYGNVVAHTFMTIVCFALFGPFYFLGLAYCVWSAALQLMFSRTFDYEVASKPTKALRQA